MQLNSAIFCYFFAVKDMSVVCYNVQCVALTCVPFTINPGKSGLIILMAIYGELSYR